MVTKSLNEKYNFQAIKSTLPHAGSSWKLPENPQLLIEIKTFLVPA